MDQRFLQLKMALAKRTTMAKITHSKKNNFTQQPMLFYEWLPWFKQVNPYQNNQQKNAHRNMNQI